VRAQFPLESVISFRFVPHITDFDSMHPKNTYVVNTVVLELTLVLRNVR